MAQYIIKKGDNLSTIAKNNGVKLKDLLSINKIDNPDYIQAGQKINLPDNKPNFKGTNYTQFSDDYNTTPKWDKITPNAGNSKTIKSTPSKQVLKSKPAPVKQNDKPGFLDSMKNKIYETYQDVTTAIDQQTSKKVVAKPKIKIDDSFINYGYKELGTYKDESFKAGKKDSLLSAMNVFDNDKGFDYIVSPKVKEGKKTFNNVKGVAHFLMDSDITPNQKYTTPYIEKGNNTVKSAQVGKFTPYLGTNPDDYVMYYKNTGNDKMNVKYGQLKDKDKYKGYEQIKVRSIPFGELDFNNKKSAGFAKKASYIGTLDGKQTSIITDPESNDVYGRFSGGSGIFHFKEPKTGKTISVDVSGSVNTIKQVGEELSKKYNVDPKQLQFLYHDMGSYSAKPKSHNGVLSNEQWENYNVNNKGYSGAALMYPMEHGGKITAETIYSMSEQPKVILTPDDIKAESGFNFQKYFPMERDIPVDTATSYNRDINRFAWKNTLQNLPEIQKQQQLPNQQIDSSYYTTKTPRGYFNVYDKQNQLVGYSMDNKTVIKQEPNFEDGGNINTLEGDLFSKVLMFRNQDKQFVDRQLHPEKYLDKIIQNPDGTHSTHKMAWGEDEKGQAYMFPTLFNDKNESIKVPNQYADYISSKGYKNSIFKENGGMIQAWIQKFAGGGSPNNPYIDPYAGMTEFNPEMETNMQSMPFQKLQTQPINQSFNNLQPKQFNTQMQVPLAQSNMPQNIGTNFKTSFDASNDQVNKDNTQASSMMGGDKMSKMNPADMALGAANMVGDVASGAINAFAKPGSKAAAYAQGSAKAQSVVKPLEKIPIIGQASKLISGIIGGALEARRQGIEDEETDKQDKQTQYLTRNTQSVNQPSYYGQYMAKYGANPKMMEQRVMDDIYSDFDKYLKLT